MSGRPVSRGAAALANLALAESPGQALENEERAELADLFRLVDKGNLNDAIRTQPNQSYTCLQLCYVIVVS